MQGRYKNTRLVVNYLKNKEKNKKASTFLNTFIDFDSLFTTRSLRLVIEKGSVSGVATYKDPNGDIKTDIYGNKVDKTSIQTKLQHYSLLFIANDGFYHSIDYSIYKMPSLLGYGSGSSVSFTLFDPKTKIQKFSYIYGYDELSYTKRYFKDVNKFFMEGLIGIGLANISISDKKELNKLVDENGYSGVDNSPALAFDYGLNIGYIFQRKSSYLKGFGISFEIGYKLRGTTYFSSTTDNNEDNKAQLVFERNDIWHGPYANINLVF